MWYRYLLAGAEVQKQRQKLVQEGGLNVGGSGERIGLETELGTPDLRSHFIKNQAHSIVAMPAV